MNNIVYIKNLTNSKLKTKTLVFLVKQVPIALPAILSVVSFAVVLLTFYQKTTESLMALGILGIGTIFYIFGYRWTNKPAAIQDKISKFKIIVC